MVGNTIISGQYENQVCQVCGDRATGYNYGSFTCDCCKSFFQRNYFIHEKLKCRKTGNCLTADFRSRKNCQKCRILKCLQVGMKPKMRHEAKKMIASNCKVQFNISALLENYIRRQNVLTCPREDDALKVEDKSCRRKYATDLSSYERKLFDELQQAMEAFVDETRLPVVGEYCGRTENVNWPLNYAKIICKFCKNLPAFNCLSQDDQLLLFKPFYVEVLSIRKMFIYDTELHRHLALANEAGTEAYYIKTQASVNPYKLEKAQKAFVKNRELAFDLISVMENDRNIRDLIIAFSLFKLRDNLSNPEFIKYQNLTYCRMIRRYLQQKYNMHQANKKYCAILDVLDRFEDVKEASRSFFDEMDISLYSDLLIELYGLT